MPLNHRTTTVTEEQSILSSINSTNNNKKKNNNSTKTSTSTTGTNNRKVVQAVTSTLIRPARTLTAIQTIIVIIIMTVVSFLSGAAIKSFGGVIRNTSNGGNVLVAAWSMTTTIPHHRRFARPQPVSHNMMGFQQEYWMHPMTGTRRHTSQLMMPSSSSSAARITSDSANNNNDNSKGYSLATQRRIQGLDSKREFSTLAMKLQKTEKELYAVLTQRLVQRRSSSSSSAAITTTPEKEKDEYVEWLITGYDAGSDDNINQPQPKKEVSGRKNQAKVTGTTVLDGSGRRQQQQTFATNVLFADRIDLHPNSKRAMAEMGLVSMTEIQDKTFGAASSGRDVLGRARTGTGKTVAFFLPAIERLVQLGIQYDPTKVGVLVVSPTRELATQIADQAEKMVAYHKGMSVQVMFGGTNIRQDINRLSSRLPTILVATPGRLLDHLQSTSIRLGGGGRSSSGQTLSFGRDIMSQTPILVLDETDRLLDMGFRTEITRIMKYLPTSTQRQTLLFSATIPPDLKTIMAQNMKKDYIEVDCINDGDVASHTNEQVRQSYVIVPGDSGRTVSSVIEIVKYATDLYDTPDCPAKVVVFFPTARLVNFYAEVFNEGRILSQPVLELHSKKTQSYRTRVSDKFRAMKRGVLFTSDVSARGVDYPNVSHVIQFGIPESRDQYIHRLGRTGRGGTDGRGWLVLSDWESRFLKELKEVDIPLNEELQDLIANKQISPESRDHMDEIRRRVRAGDQVLADSAAGAYQAFLGYYLGQMKRMGMNRKEELVDIANDFASMAGLREPPELSRVLIDKMGLRGVDGINIAGGRGTYNSDRNFGSQRIRNSHHEYSDGRRPPRNGPGGGRRR